jgi:hypothetical protein
MTVIAAATIVTTMMTILAGIASSQFRFRESANSAVCRRNGYVRARSATCSPDPSLSYNIWCAKFYLRHTVRLSTKLPAVHLDDSGLVTVGIGIRGRATERLSPVSGESLNMVGVEAVAERMGDHFVDHHPSVPGVGKTAQAGDATRRREDSLHASMMTILLCVCKVSLPV